ncbi:MAG: hypothetical protein KAW45_01720 [Thermoplasmatales archaeon]|nr:hypothetical protein [Thermoplasmatales archaeon]
MNRRVHCFLIILFTITFIFAFIKPACAENNDVIVEFFYSEDCHSCDEKKENITHIEEYYGDNITLLRLGYEDNKELFNSYGFLHYPAVVVRNETNITKIEYLQITDENLIQTIDAYLAGTGVNGSLNGSKSAFCLDTPFGKICLDPSESTLPVLTIILGAIDSVNPCSFYVLLFLLSLLLYTKSRKKMILVGGLFIFFSGFIYFLLMVAIMFFFKTIEEPTIVIIIGGTVAIIFGMLNIKDFFFFKKGPSASIPDSKKPKLYSQMRKLIKITPIPTLIIATIVLAVSANMVELICSLNLPVIYTGILTTYPMSNFGYILYLIFYNIIYIVPLLIFVSVMVVTLGRWKLSEKQGRHLKLFSGLMIFLLGVVMLTMPGILTNVFAVVGILLVSIVLAVVISFIWKVFEKN